MDEDTYCTIMHIRMHMYIVHTGVNRYRNPPKEIERNVQRLLKLTMMISLKGSDRQLRVSTMKASPIDVHRFRKVKEGFKKSLNRIFIHNSKQFEKYIQKTKGEIYT